MHALAVRPDQEQVGFIMQGIRYLLTILAAGLSDCTAERAVSTDITQGEPRLYHIPKVVYRRIYAVHQT